MSTTLLREIHLPCDEYNPRPSCCSCNFSSSCTFREAIEIFKEFRSYDIMESFMEADVEIPRRHTMYNPIYEQVWG